MKPIYSFPKFLSIYTCGMGKKKKKFYNVVPNLSFVFGNTNEDIFNEIGTNFVPPLTATQLTL